MFPSGTACCWRFECNIFAQFLVFFLLQKIYKKSSQAAFMLTPTKQPTTHSVSQAVSRESEDRQELWPGWGRHFCGSPRQHRPHFHHHRHQRHHHRDYHLLGVMLQRPQSSRKRYGSKRPACGVGGVAGSEVGGCLCRALAGLSLEIIVVI